MKAYADSSFIVALYLQQENSMAATAFMKRYRQPLVFTPWHRLEVRNAIRLSVFHKLIERAQASAQLKLVELDLRDETLLVHTTVDWVEVLREAERLGAAHSETIGCRSNDLFHVAAAVDMGCSHFVTFDDRQRKMAQSAGLNTRF